MENGKNKNKGLIIAIIIFVVVLVACCVAGVIIWRKKVNSAANKIVEYTEDYMKNYNNMKEVVVNNIDDEKNKLEEQKNEIVNEYSNKINEEVNKAKENIKEEENKLTNEQKEFIDNTKDLANDIKSNNINEEKIKDYSNKALNSLNSNPNIDAQTKKQIQDQMSKYMNR